MEPEVQVELAPRNKRSLTLVNPVMVASGTFGYGTEYAKLVDIQRLGAIVCKGTTLRPRRGNPAPRLAETPAGLLNSVGLQNIGVRQVMRRKAPIWGKWSVPVIVNIAGDSVAEYCQMAGLLDSVDGVAGLELNISCPNIYADGRVFAEDPESAAAVTRAVRQSTTLPLLVKLSPNVADLRSVALAVEEAGADALSVVNTFVGMRIDVRSRRSALGTISGGLSGPAIRPLAVWLVYQVAQVVDIPVIGVGGITSAQDALEFIMAGASAVQVGTATFVNPGAALGVLYGLMGFMQEHGVADIRELIGAAQQRFAGARTV